MLCDTLGRLSLEIWPFRLPFHNCAGFMLKRIANQITSITLHCVNTKRPCTNLTDNHVTCKTAPSSQVDQGLYFVF